MDWEAVGAIGEVAGATAVVVTLIILLRQIRENTKSTAASTAASYMQAYSAWNQGMSDPAIARIVRIGSFHPDELTPDESQAFFQLLSAAVPLWEAMFYMQRERTIPEPHWRACRHDMVTTGSTVGGRRFFEGLLSFYDAAFPEFANEIRVCLDEHPTYQVLDGVLIGNPKRSD